MDMRNIAGSAKAMEEVNRFSKKMTREMESTVIETENDFIILGLNLKYELTDIQIKYEGVSVKKLEKAFSEAFLKVTGAIGVRNTEFQSGMIEKAKEIKDRYM